MIKKLFNKTTTIFITVLLMISISGCSTNSDKEKINVLILPKFEIGELSGDEPGEAQFYYENYCMGGEEYDIGDNKLYLKDGVAMYITGAGKVNSVLAIENVLRDERFDFGDALILSTGCAGSARDFGVMGDVYLISATVDMDLGHLVDSRELSDKNLETTWYHDETYDDVSHRLLNENLVSQVYELVKDTKLETTEKTRNYMSAAFDGADWATRDPMVLKGTSITCDNYWKGETGHANALLAVSTYDCPDPYAATEMEDNAIAVTLDDMGMLDHLVILRDSVNTDVFMNGATPESLWDPNYKEEVESGYSVENADIFDIAMENNFKVGQIIIDSYLNGSLTINR